MSAILVDLYDSRSLSQAINKVAVVEPFVLNAVFGTKEQHDSDKVDIEIIAGSSKVAQFVNADEPNPRPASKLTKTIKTVTIPRTYESKVFTAHQLKNIGVAGGIYSTAAERKAAQEQILILELADMKERIVRLREYMACAAISAGKISISQPNIEFEIDFDFVTSASGQIRTYTGADLWTASTGNPIKNIRDWQKSIMKASYQQGSICILGTAAAAAFIGNENIIKQLDANNLKTGQMDLNSKLTIGAQYLGRIAGVDFYEYVQQYVTAGGVATDMIPTDRAILVAPGNTNRLHYGPAFRITPKGVDTFNGEFLLEIDSHSSNTMLQWNCEQKSLPAIHDPGAIVSVKVV